MRQAGAKAQQTSGRRRSNGTNPPDVDIRGVLHLLRAAQSSLVLHFRDGPAADMLDQCIAELAARGPAKVPGEHAKDKMPAELNLTALVRMLVYVQAEIDQTLGNARATRLLKQCIDHLLHQQYFHQQNGPGHAAITSH